MLSVPNWAEVLETAAQRIWEGQIHDAYTDFSLPRCGPSFFTKVLYAFGLGADRRPLPLILDERVENSLGRLARDGEFNAADFSASPAGYMRYVKNVNQWATEIGCRPDAVEFLLFDPAQAFWLWQANRA